MIYPPDVIQSSNNWSQSYIPQSVLERAYPYGAPYMSPSSDLYGRWIKNHDHREKKKEPGFEATLKQQRLVIDLFNNGGQIKYSFVLMLISLATTRKFH